VVRAIDRGQWQAPLGSSRGRATAMEICGRDGRMLAARLEQKNGMTKGRQKWRDAPLTKKAPYKPDGTIAAPTIAVNFRQSLRKRCAISLFMEEIEKALLISFEMMLVHLCSKHVQPFAGMPVVVAPLPENYQSAWRVRFGYGMYHQDGQFAPIG
jgi:hypothetical protein